MDKLEKIARAMRDAMYPEPIKDDAWEACKQNWMKDAGLFMRKLDGFGLEVVAIKKP